MRIDRLLQMFTGDVCLLEPRTLRLGGQLLHRKLLGEAFGGIQIHTELGVTTPTQRREATESGIAVIPILGVIEQRMHSLGTSVEEIGMAVDVALASKRVDGIVFDVDSPGGGVTGVPELAEKIYTARGVKPTASISNGMMGSAALWLGLAAQDVWAIQSGDTGSLGVYMLHIDESKALEDEGVVVTEFSAGRYKTEGAPWAPLSEEASEFFQSRVDEVYGWFVAAMAQFRADIPDNVMKGYGEGRMLGAKQAKVANLVDKIGTFEEVVSSVAQLGSKPKGRRAATLREEMALDIGTRST